jgi:hypothetical protein
MTRAPTAVTAPHMLALMDSMLAAPLDRTSVFVLPNR